MEILHIQLPDWSTLALLAYDIDHVLIACVGRFWPLCRLRCVRCVRCVRLETGLQSLYSSLSLVCPPAANQRNSVTSLQPLARLEISFPSRHFVMICSDLSINVNVEFMKMRNCCVLC